MQKYKANFKQALLSELFPGIIHISPNQRKVTATSNSPFTPYTLLAIVTLAQQFFPPGVLQALSGDDALGPWLTAHPLVEKISFTGSTFTGKKVMQSTAGTMKRITLELGGNDPAIVFDDVDIEGTAQKICMCVKRIYVHSSVYTVFRDAIARAVNKFSVGNGLDPGVTHGPVQNALQYSNVREFLIDAEKEGQHVVVGGEIPPELGSAQNYFINPTIIDELHDEARLVVEEPFGPVLPLLSFDTEEDLIPRVNATRTGLAASVWTTDLIRGRRVAENLEVGTVWINRHLGLKPGIPFAGWKESGFGCEFGKDGLQEWCRAKVIFLQKSK
ncbi:putative aldehyde dehydrogenase [Lachnellula willkommii]|uniref:aldehyde dehydrogenase (NAD(+)) n=1 Tax=Lachnellula willkommii TaxID=215461 RepID=A0A559M799_9HELO|nr:putative aldehyde dehydrogenase [Lachnellula willkommii]